MTLSRWISVSIFALAVVAAWQFAQSSAQTAPQQVTTPTGIPLNNAACTDEVSKPQLFVAPPEPPKISLENFRQ